MARYCICWLACCSLLLPLPVRAADMPVSAEFFLQSIEPEPSSAMLYDFLDIFGKDFAACKEIDTYLRALNYLAAKGNTSTVRDRLKAVEACPGLSEFARQQLAALRQNTAEPVAPASVRAPLVSALTAPATVQSAAQPGAVAAAEPITPAATPAIPASPAAPATSTAPAASATSTPPATGEPVAAPQAETASQAAALPQTTAAETASQISTLPQTTPPPQIAGLSQATPTETPTQIATNATPQQVAQTVPAPHEKTTPSPSRSEKHKKSRVRRTSLPVAPTIPMPSRIVPPAALAPVPSVQPAAPTPVVADSSPWHSELASRAVYRTGTEGTSRLLRLENTATFGYGSWTFSATALTLNAGAAGDNEFAGSYYRGKPQRSLLTEQTAFIPQIAYDGDQLDFSLGTSPLGGVVAPLPTFRLSYTAFDSLKLAVFQESVTDSLLSYTGFRDPVTGERMGRVMKTGVRVGWDDTFAENWFYGGALTGAWLYGENVKDNTQVRGEFYIGRSFGSVAVGSYSAVDHYRTNLNNYTFGHGGYYSPQLAATSVIFVSWEYAGAAGRIKADISSGYLYEETRNTSLYYGADGAPEGVYRGETHHRITVNAGLEGSLNITDTLRLNSSVRVINSGTFTETRGAVYLKWEF